MDIKRFKAWAESKKLSTDGETGRNYSYTFYDSKTQAAWGAWQAKAQAVPEGFVLVRNELPESIAEQMAVDRTIKPSPERDPVWMEIAESAYKSNLLNKKWELYRDYKEMIEAQEQKG